jgi:hypothetical protein
MKNMRILLLIAALCQTIIANADERDDAVFGGEQPSGSDKLSTTVGPSPNLTDKIITGGLLDLNWNYSHRKGSSGGDSPFNSSQAAELFFDNMPTADYRALVRLRATAGREVSPADIDRIHIDEAWLRWDAKRFAFFTLGRQHLKWGAGRFWNPTDFLARTAKDPWSSRDRRMGQDLLKIHIPSEKQGFNYYLVADFGKVDQAKDTEGALRGEFAIGGIAEVSLTAATKPEKGARFGADASSAAGPVDLYLEVATLPREKHKVLSGSLDVEGERFPEIIDGNKGYGSMAVAGLAWNIKYSTLDTLAVGLEFFDNGFGYTTIEDEIFALTNGLQNSLYLGRRYAAASIFLPKPGSWDDFSFLLLGIENISDQSNSIKFQTTWSIGSGLSLELSAAHCGGQNGELCFVLPKSYGTLVTNSQLPPDVRERLALVPRARELYSIGAGVTAKF